MALILYLIKVPRYKNILTDRYETIPIADLSLIDRFCVWKMQKEKGANCGNTFEEWCGIPESKLPHKHIVNYYSDFFTPKRFYKEHIGDVTGYTIFTPCARIVKSNQVFRWFIDYVMCGKPDQEYHEITKDQLADLLYICRRVRKGFVPISDENLHEKKYSVNEELAKQFLPVMDKTGYFFGTTEYDAAYACGVIETLHAVKSIISTTNFEKETVYFNAVW